MKTAMKIFTVALVGLGLVSGNVAFAHGCGSDYQNGPRRGNNDRLCNMEAVDTFRQEMFQARADTLAELSGVAANEISAKLEYKPMWAVLDEYEVDYTEFRTKMQKTGEESIKKAAEEGKISEECKNSMLERLKEGPRKKFKQGGKRGGRKGGNFRE